MHKKKMIILFVLLIFTALKLFSFSSTHENKPSSKNFNLLSAHLSEEEMDMVMHSFLPQTETGLINKEKSIGRKMPDGQECCRNLVRSAI